MDREEIKKIIQGAINDEIESYEFYSSAAEKVKTQSVKDIFKKLAEDEKNHKVYLEEFLNSKAENITVVNDEDYAIAEEIEDDIALTTDMSFVDAIKLAIKKEETAMKKYKGLADICSNEEIKNIFLGLCDMEQMHKCRLEDIFVNVAYTETW